MALLETVRAERVAKIARLQEAGMEAYPARTNRTHSVAQFLQNHETLLKNTEEVTLAGRILSIREHGGSLFIDIFDGTKGQSYVQRDKLGEESFNLFKDTVDTGDIIEFRGRAFTTKRGVPSLDVLTWRMLAKSLRPLPDEWFGIKDEDERFRKRYLDILLTKDLADRFRRRSAFWNTFRTFLLERDYIEVETPVLETTTGGADARPFETHHNALDIDVYLRISAGELWQKRLMVAGLPKVFEIGRIFRNEGMSFEHAQDYTQIEFYEAFKDYEAGMEMLTELYRTIADKVYGTRVFTVKELTFDLDAPWQRYDFCEIIKKEFGIDPLDTDAEKVRAVLDNRRISYDASGFNLERGVDLLWKQIRKTLAGPGFLIGVPVYLETLAKRSSSDPRVVERFQIILGGSEVGKGFSELNDPIDQRGRFEKQQALRDAGDEEAQMADEDYVEALEYGMPPAFGFGISERLFSFLEGVSIREGQIFPLMRPRETEPKKSIEKKKAVVVVKRSGLEPWQILNTVAHLSAEFGVREGKDLLYQDSLTTADGTRIPLNIQHPIMLKDAPSVESIKNLFRAAQEQKLQVTAFTREMIETTNDKKIIQETAAKDFIDVEFLGVLLFGPISAVENLTAEFRAYT